MDNSGVYDCCSSLIVAENIGHAHQKVGEIIHLDKHNLCSWKWFRFGHMECNVIISLLIHIFKTLDLLHLWREVREMDVTARRWVHFIGHIKSLEF